MNPEKFGANTNSEIPGDEISNMSESPVTKEEMDAELKNLNEALHKENIEIENGTETTSTGGNAETINVNLEDKKETTPRQEIDTNIEARKEAEEIERMKNEEKAIEIIRNDLKQKSNNNGNKQESNTTNNSEQKKKEKERMIHETNIKNNFKICERCMGSGRRFFFFMCPVCKGNGRVIDNQTISQSQKPVKA
jgi:hypothetical protein